jgi:hypothetical protein
MTQPHIGGERDSGTERCKTCSLLQATWPLTALYPPPPQSSCVGAIRTGTGRLAGSATARSP